MQLVAMRADVAADTAIAIVDPRFTRPSLAGLHEARWVLTGRTVQRPRGTSLFSGLVLALASLAGPSGCSADAPRASVSVATPGPSPDSATGECAAGTSFLGPNQTCTAVGTSDIPTGFVGAADGWGFVPVVTENSCKAATRASLGAPECVPLDDCTAPFPPSEASVVVSSATGDWTKPTVRTLDEAVATGASVIAIDRGTYAGGVALTRNVSFVGRCARDTIIAGAPGNDDHGIASADSRGRVSVSSLTLRKFVRTAAGAVHGGIITLRHVLLQDNGAGVAAGSGGHATIDESVIESTEKADPRAPSVGLEAQSGGVVEASACELRGLAVNFASQDAGSRIAIKRSVLDSQEVTASNNLFAAVLYDSSAEITESVLRGREHTISVGHPDANVGAQDRARLTVSSSVMMDLPSAQGHQVDPKDPAFWVNAGAELTLENVSVRGAERRAVYATGTAAHARLSNVLVAPLADQPRGPQGVIVLDGAQADLEHVAIVHASGAGLLVAGAGSRMAVRNSLVFGATAADGVALGMAAVDEATLLAEDVTVSKNENNGIVITAAKAELTRVLVSRNYGLDPSRGVGIGAARDAFVAVRDSEVVHNNVAGFFFIGASALVANTVVSGQDVGVLWSGVTLRNASTETPPPDTREVVLIDTDLGTNKAPSSETTDVAPVPEPAY
jgi:hypothetical protein